MNVSVRPKPNRLPWNDKAGRFQPLKAATLALVALPAVSLAYSATVTGLGPRPLTAAIHDAGDWAVYLLLVTLAVTPARRLFDWGKLIQVRRILGLSALFYVLLHFSLYVVDSRVDLVFVASEIVLRIYLAIGFLALIGLSVLGITSTDAMIARLGGSRWNRLHKLVYGLTALAILHYYMQSKLDVSAPVMMTGFFAWLMGYRLMARLGWKDGIAPLLVLSLGAAAVTALAEAAWYGIATGVGFWRPLAANLDPDLAIRPAWLVLLAGLAVTAIAASRRRNRTSRVGARATATG